MSESPIPASDALTPFAKDGWQHAVDNHLVGYGRTSDEFASPHDAMRWLLEQVGAAAVALSPSPAGVPSAPVDDSERQALIDLLLSAMEWGRDYWASFSMRGQSQREVAEQFADQWRDRAALSPLAPPPAPAVQPHKFAKWWGGGVTAMPHCSKCGRGRNDPLHSTPGASAPTAATATADACRKCGGQMKPGKAMQSTLIGSPDFPGDTGNEAGCTLSPGGPGRLIDCMKCERCGWSTTTADLGEKA